MHKTTGDLGQSQFSFLSRSQNIARPNPRLGENAKNNQKTKTEEAQEGTKMNKILRIIKVEMASFFPSILSCM